VQSSTVSIRLIFPNSIVTDYSDREGDHLVFSDATNDGGTSLNETSAYFRGGRNLQRKCQSRDVEPRNTLYAPHDYRYLKYI